MAYSFIGVIGAEFIMSRSGIGYEIGFAYNNFDNATMYPLIVLMLAVVDHRQHAVLSGGRRVLLARRGANEAAGGCARRVADRLPAGGLAGAVLVRGIERADLARSTRSRYTLQLVAIAVVLAAPRRDRCSAFAVALAHRGRRAAS